MVDEVRRLIRDGGLKAGDTLPAETAIGGRLGVSRTVVREAYRSMAALRLIDVGNGRRARVASIDENMLSLAFDHAVQIDQVSVQQVLDVRRAIEMRGVYLAALRRTDEQAERISGLAAGMRAAIDDATDVMELDIAFHKEIARATNNPMFALTIGAFEDITRKTWPVGWNIRKSLKLREESVACHEDIAAAIARRDPVEAEEQMARHFDDTTRILLQTGTS